MTLVHCPGETPDQIVVYVDASKLLIAADNIYQSFPNIYAIRGSPSRDAMLWARSLDTMRALGASILVPMHTRPVHGGQTIFELLTAYRDAIQFVHDQTVFHMNRGLTPDEIVQRVRLPPHLAAHAWLQPFYGTVHWSVRAIFAHYLGWFSGAAHTLHPSPPGALASAVVRACASDAAGLPASERLLAAAEALHRGVNGDGASVPRDNYQLSLEISTLVIEAAAAGAQRTSPLLVSVDAQQRALALQRRALTALAAQSVAATGRNYYSTAALELDEQVDLVVPQALMAANLRAIDSTETLLRTMAVNLDIEASFDAMWLCRISFVDTRETYYLHVRRGVLDVVEEAKASALLPQLAPASPDLSIETTRAAWCDLMARERSPVAMLATGEMRIVHGSVLQLTKFRTFFSSPRD